MDYMQTGSPQADDKMKKIIIGASIALAVIGLAVFAIILVRRNALSPVGPSGPKVVAPPVTQPPGIVTGATSTPAVPLSITIGAPQPGALPPDAIAPPIETTYPPDLNRPMTPEEKTPYGWGEKANIWIRTTKDADGKTAVSFYDPKAPVPPPDADNDGLSDADEARYGTDPHNRDTDGDLLTDGVEIGLGSNPLKADSNGDGVNDYLEFERTAQITVDADGDVVPKRR